METSKDVGLSDYFASIKRRRRLALAIALPIVVGACVLAFTLPTTYSSPAEFRFEKAAIDDNQVGAAARNNYVDEYVSKLSESVLSGDKLKALRAELSLYPDIMKPAEALTKLKSDIHVEMIKEQFLDPESGHQKDVNSGFRVSYDSRTPANAQKVSQWIADEFVAVSRQKRHDKSVDAAKFLQHQADQYKAQVTELEAKVAVFKQQHVGELPDSAQNTIAEKERLEQDLNNSEAELRTLTQNRTFMASQLQQVPAAADSANLRELQDQFARKKTLYDENHPDMIALRHQIETLQRANTMGAGSSLQAELASQKLVLEQFRQRYSDDHPDVRRLQRDIATLEARIAAGEKTDSKPTVSTNPIAVQLQTQISGIDNQAASLQIRRSELRAKLRQLEDRVIASPQAEKTYEAMTRDLTLSHDKYDELLKRKMEEEFGAAASLNGSGDEFRMVTTPSVPLLPSKPSRAGIVLVGVVLAAMLAFGAALAAEAFDATVRGSKDLGEILGVTPIAVVPDIRNSAFRKQRFREAALFAASMAAVIPVLYFVITLVVH